ncbi:MAG: C39 family peptidase [Roseibacillus sp.]
MVFLLGTDVMVGQDELTTPEIALNRLIEAPECWSLTPKDLAKAFHEDDKFGLVWLTKDKTRAKLSRYRFTNIEIDLSLFEKKVPVDEVVVDFEKGRVSVVSLSLFSRGDSARISTKDFKERFLICGKEVGSILGTKPQTRKANAKQGMPIEGYFWESKKGLALLTHNEGALSTAQAPAFLRLRLASPRSKSPLVQAMRNRRGGCAVKLSQLRSRVRNDEEGNTFIADFPMVDQGNKGYCVVASAQRVFEYYGVGIDMHQIAEIAGSDPSRGTSSYQMAKELDEIDYRFKTRLEVLAMISSRRQLSEIKQSSDGYRVGKAMDLRGYIKDIKSSIDEGVPLLWGLQLGRFPETPNLNPQTEGGHMRTIIGYQEKKGLVIFSDSWGAGHEFKTMTFDHAYQATTGLFRLKPIVN